MRNPTEPAVVAMPAAGTDAASEQASRAADAQIEALADYYRTDYDALHAMALAMVRSPEAAHDAVQETFAYTMKCVKEKGVEIRNPQAWMRVVLRNHCLTHLRERTHLPLMDHAERLHTETTEKIAQHREQIRDIWAVAETLPAAQRSAFHLADVRGYEYKEIAETLGRTENATRLLLFRARKRVRQALGPDSLPQIAPALYGVLIAHERARHLARSLREYVAGKLGALASALARLMQRPLDSAVQPALPAICAVLVVAGGGSTGTVAPPAFPDSADRAPSANLAPAPGARPQHARPPYGPASTAPRAAGHTQPVAPQETAAQRPAPEDAGGVPGQAGTDDRAGAAAEGTPTGGDAAEKSDPAAPETGDHGDPGSDPTASQSGDDRGPGGPAVAIAGAGSSTPVDHLPPVDPPTTPPPDPPPADQPPATPKPLAPSQ